MTDLSKLQDMVKKVVNMPPEPELVLTEDQKVDGPEAQMDGASQISAGESTLSEHRRKKMETIQSSETLPARTSDESEVPGSASADLARRLAAMKPQTPAIENKPEEAATAQTSEAQASASAMTADMNPGSSEDNGEASNAARNAAQDQDEPTGQAEDKSELNREAPKDEGKPSVTLLASGDLLPKYTMALEEIDDYDTLNQAIANNRLSICKIEGKPHVRMTSSSIRKLGLGIESRIQNAKTEYDSIKAEADRINAQLKMRESMLAGLSERRDMMEMVSSQVQDGLD